MSESHIDATNSMGRPWVAKYRCEMVNDATSNGGSAMNEVLTSVCQVGVCITPYVNVVAYNYSL